MAGRNKNIQALVMRLCRHMINKLQVEADTDAQGERSIRLGQCAVIPAAALTQSGALRITGQQRQSDDIHRRSRQRVLAARFAGAHRGRDPGGVRRAETQRLFTEHRHINGGVVLPMRVIGMQVEFRTRGQVHSSARGPVLLQAVLQLCPYGVLLLLTFSIAKRFALLA